MLNPKGMPETLEYVEEGKLPLLAQQGWPEEGGIGADLLDLQFQTCLQNEGSYQARGRWFAGSAARLKLGLKVLQTPHKARDKYKHQL